MALIDKYLILMAEMGASDLHFNSGNSPIWRIHGDIKKIEDEKTITKEVAKEVLYEIMPEFNRDEFERCHDTDFCYELNGFGRFRTNIFKDMKGIGGVFRLIPEKIITL